jgi:hypothetical protein
MHASRVKLVVLAIVGLFLSSGYGQEAPKRIYLSQDQSQSAAVGLSSRDMIKAISEKCSNVVITNDRSRANYVLETAYAWCCTPRGESRGYKFTLFNENGDAFYSTQTHTLANAVKDICEAINSKRPKK